MIDGVLSDRNGVENPPSDEAPVKGSPQCEGTSSDGISSVVKTTTGGVIDERTAARLGALEGFTKLRAINDQLKEAIKRRHENADAMSFEVHKCMQRSAPPLVVGARYTCWFCTKRSRHIPT